MIAESLENLARWPAWPEIGEGMVDALPEPVIETRFSRAGYSINFFRRPRPDRPQDSE